MDARIAVPGAQALNVGAKELSTPSLISTETEALSRECDLEWKMLRAASILAKSLSPDQSLRLIVGANGELIDLSSLGDDDLAPQRSGMELCWQRGGWTLVQSRNLSPLADLYLPICSATPAAPLTIGHLGQSLDGNIATASGDSDFVTGPGNILHLHRMRALCDAVIVGAGTARDDNPTLTTRLCDGPNPVRVVIDPNRSLPLDLALFSDAGPQTLLVVADHTNGSTRHGQAEVLKVPTQDGQLNLAALLDALHDRDLRSIFVEGGGVTVSRFLEADLCDRLQVAVAPLLTGHGRPGLQLSAREAIADCLRPVRRLFAMGDDVLFDCDLRATHSDGIKIDASRLHRIN